MTTPATETASNDTDTDTKTRASGVARIGALLDKADDAVKMALHLAKRWTSVEKPDEILVAMIPEMETVVTALTSSMEGAKDLVARGFVPPKPKAVPVNEGEKVTLREESADRYVKSGIKAKDVLIVAGEGPAKGTVWVDLPNKSRQMVAKSDIVRA